MYEELKKEILLAKAEAEAMGVTINLQMSGSIDYNDAGLIAMDSIEAYFTFTYDQMLGEYKRKIEKAKSAYEQNLAKTFMINNF